MMLSVVLGGSALVSSSVSKRQDNVQVSVIFKIKPKAVTNLWFMLVLRSHVPVV